MGQNRISFQYSGRYFDNGLSHNEASHILLAFHGQGQLAEYFIKKFEPLKELGIRVIAPEGLSRYYIEGNYGRVGASWMTKEDRLNDIDNYLRFINSIYREEVLESGFQGEVSALGFSQGAATVSRWISQPEIKFHRLILWAGMFPPDLNWDVSRDQLKGKEVWFAYGLQDQYITDDRFKEQEEISEQLGVNPNIITFDGPHTVDSETLVKLFTKDRD